MLKIYNKNINLNTNIKFNKNIGITLYKIKFCFNLKGDKIAHFYKKLGLN